MDMVVGYCDRLGQINFPVHRTGHGDSQQDLFASTSTLRQDGQQRTNSMSEIV
jgi:hypothetical protein